MTWPPSAGRSAATPKLRHPECRPEHGHPTFVFQPGTGRATRLRCPSTSSARRAGGPTLLSSSKPRRCGLRLAERFWTTRLETRGEMALDTARLVLEKIEQGPIHLRR